jgi:hypothetical protein
MSEPFNPLEKKSIAESIATALLRQKTFDFEPTSYPVGAGVYAIYYGGQFPAYKRISFSESRPETVPIYVGKAIPRGGRKGGLGNDASTGNALAARLSQHATSIEQTQNLSVRDFRFRCLVVDDIWIPLGENALIERYQPVWNLVVDGFGNKDPGAGRQMQRRSPWDQLHPGRKFASSLPPGAETADQISLRVAEWLELHLPVVSGSDGSEPPP